MNPNNKLLFLLLRAALNPEISADSDAAAAFFVGTEPAPADWETVYRLAAGQGLLVVAWEGYMALFGKGAVPVPMPKRLKMQWYGASVGIEERQKRKFETAAAFAQMLHEEHIQTIVLKGAAYALYYPNVWSREYGDLDCYLGGDYQRGNELSAHRHAKVSDGGYKHSHIDYRGLSIENHRFFTGHNHTKTGIRTEYRLRDFFGREPAEPIEGTRLYRPNRDFTALFLVCHAQRHFFYEGITVRHLTDWAQFLRAEQDKVDWGVVYQAMDALNMRKFADLMTGYCVFRLGLKLTNRAVTMLPDRGEVTRFEADLFAPHPSLEERNLFKKTRRILHRFRRAWRFSDYAYESFPVRVWNTFAFSSYLHRNPELGPEKRDATP